MEKLTHINENGEAIMVDVSGKAVTAGHGEGSESGRHDLCRR